MEDLRQTPQDENKVKPRLPKMPTVPSVDTSPKSEQDAESVALKIGWIGLGQGGGKIADYFHKLGYGKVIALNSTQQDFSGLGITHRLVLGDGAGAGKDIERASSMIKPRKEDIFNLMEKVFGEDLDFIILTAGLGGGSGSGFVIPMIEVAKEYFKFIGKEDLINKRVGALVSLPKISEGTKVQENATEISEKLVNLSENKKISPLIIIDNEKAVKLIKGLTLMNEKNKLNEFICKGLHVLNRVASWESEISTFDRQDFISVMESGTITYGFSSVDNYESETAITDAIKFQMKNSLLADCNNFEQATHASIVALCGIKVLETMRAEVMDNGLKSLARLMGENSSVIHSGIYEYGDGDLLTIYSILGGIRGVADRLTKRKTD